MSFIDNIVNEFDIALKTLSNKKAGTDRPYPPSPIEKNTEEIVPDDQVDIAWDICKACNGQGMVMHINQIRPGMVQQIQAPCDKCNRTGSNIKDEYCFFYGITSDKMNNITKLRNEFVVSMNDEDYRTYIENLIFNINNEHSNIEKISNNFQNMSVVSSSSSSSVFQTQSNINVEEKKKLLEIRKKKISLELQQLELEEEEQKMLTNSI